MDNTKPNQVPNTTRPPDDWQESRKPTGDWQVERKPAADDQNERNANQSGQESEVSQDKDESRNNGNPLTSEIV